VARRKGPVEKATEGDLQKLRLSHSALGMTALELARQLDDKATPAAAKATVARALIRSLEKVRELTPAAATDNPAAKEKDGLDELASRRASRRRGTKT
jgi:hypothetical protein